MANFLQGYCFDGGAGAIPTPATLRNQTINLGDRQPLAFLCLIPGVTGALKVAILLRLMRYMDISGEEEPSGFHDRVLGLVGDIIPHQYPTVDVPSTIFHLAGAPVRVPTVATMGMLLTPTWDNPSVPLGPFTVEVGETEMVRPRNVQLVPGYLAALLIIVGASRQQRWPTKNCRDRFMHATRWQRAPMYCWCGSARRARPAAAVAPRTVLRSWHTHYPR